MPKKCPDKQQNQEELPLSLGPPQPAPVDDEAFARRAGEIIGNSNSSRHKAREKHLVQNKPFSLIEAFVSLRGRRG